MTSSNPSFKGFGTTYASGSFPESSRLVADCEPPAPPPYSEYDTYAGPQTPNAVPTAAGQPQHIPATPPPIVERTSRRPRGFVSQFVSDIFRPVLAPATVVRQSFRHSTRTHRNVQQPVPPPTSLPCGVFYTATSGVQGPHGGTGVPPGSGGYLITGTGGGIIDCGGQVRNGGGEAVAPGASGRAGAAGGGVVRGIWVTKNCSFFGSLDLPTAIRFQDLLMRHAFVRNVYSILTVQMVIICGVAATFLFADSVKTYSREHIRPISISAIVLMCATFLFGSMCSEAWKYAPGKYSCLVVLTASLSFFFGAFTSLYRSEVPMMMAGLVAVTNLILVSVTCQSKVGFTYSCGTMVAFCSAFVVCSAGVVIVSCVLDDMESVVNSLYASVAVIILCVHQAYNVGLMVGGMRDAPIFMGQQIYVAIKLYLNLLFFPVDSIFIILELSDYFFGWRTPGARRG